MKFCLWPAKRHRKLRMRAAVQHSTGITAERRMVGSVSVTVVCVLWLSWSWSSNVYKADKTCQATKNKSYVVLASTKGPVIHLYPSSYNVAHIDMAINL